MDNSDIDVEALHLLSGRPVHVGPVVTIPGTLLQNRRLLRFYKTIWTAIGIEMEGTYFEEALNQARVMGIISEDVRSRYLYFVSDTPLVGSEASLSANMTITEEIVPTYAITRILLQLVLMPKDTSSDAVIARPAPLTRKPSLRAVDGVIRAITRMRVHTKDDGSISTNTTDLDEVSSERGRLSRRSSV